MGLWSLAVLGPFLELAAEPAFVVAHGLSGVATAVFGLALLIGVPLVLVAGCGILDRVSDSRVACNLTVATLAGLAVMSLLSELGWVAVVLAIAAGITVQVMRWHLSLAVTILSTLAGSIVWFGPSDVGGYIRAGGEEWSTGVTVPDPVPIVLIVFDELPLHALLDSDLTINSERYPAFADVARQSTFFRLASSVSPQTADSLPALLSGVAPQPQLAPIGTNFPTSILNLFSDTHEILASEVFTRLCDGENCDRSTEQGIGLSLLIEDTFIYLSDAMLPFYQNDAVRRSWSHFRSGPQVGEYVEPGSSELIADGWTSAGEVERFRELFSRSPSGGRPPLYFLHSILPHQPYSLTTDGTVYQYVELPGSEGGTVWPDDERVRMAGWQRLQMQLVATDKLLGEAVKQLRDSDIWDEAVVVLTSDHGLTFEPGPTRKPGSAPLETTAALLLVKPPGGTGAEVSDLPALTFDIPPTLVAIQGGEPESVGFDGVDLFAGQVPSVRTDAYLSGGKIFTPVQDLDALRELVALRALWIDPEGGPAEVFRVGEAGPLVGEPPPFPSSTLEGTTVSLPFDLGSRTPAGSHLVAIFGVTGYEGDELLLAIDDVVAGIGVRVGDGQFHVALNPDLTPDHPASVQVLTPDGMVLAGG